MARTETVTVLFTDLVGSTELASQIGHDAYEQLRREHFAALRAAVTKHNGSEIKTTGDGLMLSFASAADAVACAIALQQAAERQGRQARRPAATNSPSSSSSGSVIVGAGVPACPPVQIRVGISSGEATREEADLYGPPVVEASRLCAAAAAEQILWEAGHDDAEQPLRAWYKEASAAAWATPAAISRPATRDGLALPLIYGLTIWNCFEFVPSALVWSS